MIARNIILFLLLIIIPFAIADRRYFRKDAWWIRLLKWAPCIALLGYTFHLAQERDFIPGNDRIAVLYIYLGVVMLIGGPNKVADEPAIVCASAAPAVISLVIFFLSRGIAKRAER